MVKLTNESKIDESNQKIGGIKFPGKISGKI
jgi:hypothetical protein